MNPRFIHLVFLLCCGPLAANAAFSLGHPFAKASVTPDNLRCEYLQEPVGLDVREPRLSWQLQAVSAGGRGQRQTGYQVLVSSGQRSLAKHRGDLWDSGEVASSQSLHVPYQGKPLASGQECFWTVRVRDERGKWSRWSSPARWTMGLLAAADWSAKWIGGDQVFVRKKSDNDVPDPWFRKSFELAKNPSRAQFYVASVGYHELFVNGRKVGDTVLAPCATDHTKRARYATYEITEYLKPGTNVIGLWLGVSWSIFPPYKTADKPQTPIVIAQGDIQLTDGQTVRVATDETWKTHPSPNRLLGVWDFTNFGGELYDASQEIPNWCEAGLDDSAWKMAIVYTPKLELSAENVEPNRLVKELKPVAIEPLTNGQYRVDMGVNFAGWIEARLRGQPGQRIDFQFSERAEQAMTHRHHSAYILGPSGQGLFRNRFNYSVGRWITVKGLTETPKLSDFRGWLARTDYRRAAEFECANPLLNNIYRTTYWTYENLSLGGYVVDCAQRERMGYGGDAHATTETALNAYHLGAFYTKWAQDWRDVQGKPAAWGVGIKAGEVGSGHGIEMGNLPYTAPTYWGGGGPGWSGYCVTLPWLMYQFYGDTRLLNESLPTIERWLGFLETKATNDMLARWGGEWDFLGDWLWPGAEGVNGNTRETLFYNNCYWIFNLQTASRIAGVLGKKDAAEAWRQRADTVRRAVHKTFFNPADNSYVNGFQAYLAVALLVDLPPANLRAGVWKRFEDEILVVRKGHFHAGITGGYYVLKALLENNRPDLIYTMATQEDYPSWGRMLKQGATTLWEDWEGKLSLAHSSYLHIGMCFNEGLAGIRPDPQGGGYQHFILRPGVLNKQGLPWAKASFESPYGTIVSDWKVENGKLRLRATVPPNTTATLYLPTRNIASIRESGQPVGRATGVKATGGVVPIRTFELEPGKYLFETEY